MNNKTFIKNILEEYEKQDNLGSAYPYIVLVQERFLDRENLLADYCRCEELSKEALDEEMEFLDEIEERSWIREHWHTIQIFFTKKAANAFIEEHKHCYNELRTYIQCIEHFNSELCAVMDIIGLKEAFQRKMESLRKKDCLCEPWIVEE